MKLRSCAPDIVFTGALAGAILAGCATQQQQGSKIDDLRNQANRNLGLAAREG